MKPKVLTNKQADALKDKQKAACWDALNDRRIDLIEKNLAENGLSVGESAELAALEKATDIALEIVFKPSMDELNNFVQQLKDGGKWLEQEGQQ